MPLNPNSLGSASGWNMQPREPQQPTQQPTQPPPQQRDWREKVSAFMQSIGVPTDEMQKFIYFMYSDKNPGVVQNVKNAYAPAQQQAQPQPPPQQAPTINTRLTPQQIADMAGNPMPQ
ncbi:MAG: hypothetical protein KGI71_03810 [Patescibacteria group bacterium]|nr:hypothetical protein [Patescibacteria group bacterium]